MGFFTSNESILMFIGSKLSFFLQLGHNELYFWIMFVGDSISSPE